MTKYYKARLPLNTLEKWITKQCHTEIWPLFVAFSHFLHALNDTSGKSGGFIIANQDCSLIICFSTSFKIFIFCYDLCLDMSFCWCWWFEVWAFCNFMSEEIFLRWSGLLNFFIKTHKIQPYVPKRSKVISPLTLSI